GGGDSGRARVDVGDGDGDDCTVSGHCQRDSAPDPAARPGHQYDLIRQYRHRCLPYWPTASLTHLPTKLVFAAPASFFSAACASQSAVESFSHLPTKLFFAAPASFFSAAMAPQVADARQHFSRKLVLAAPASFFSVACCVQLDARAGARGSE